MVVNHICEIVGWEAVSLNENLVVKGFVFNAYVAENFVVEGGCALVGNFLADT